MPINYDITECFGIEAENLKITGCLGLKDIKGVTSLVFTGYVSYEPTGCECCGIKNVNHTVIKHGSRQTTVYMGRVFDRPDHIKLKKQRFCCKECGQTYTAKTPYIDACCTISNSVKLMMTKRLSKVISEKDIAEDLCVSPSTVHRHLKSLNESIQTTVNRSLPRHLSFDEFKSTSDVDSAMSFIYCDGITHDIIDILPDRRKHKLEEYFLRFSKRQRKKVKTVSVDMFTPYISLIESLFPNADIIIDRFHIVQAINREINRCRIRIMNLFKSNERPKYNKLKRHWKLLLKPANELDRMHYHPFRLFDNWHSQYSLVQYLLGLSEELEMTYITGHFILEALKSNCIKKLEVALYSSKRKPIFKGLKRVIQTLIKYLPYITNTVKYPHLTNGPIEGINNKIKLIKRVSYGYRNFYNFRNRILVISRMFVSKHKKRTKSLKIAT